MLELVVVVTILAILTASVGLSVSIGDRGRRSDTEQLTVLDAQLRDAALFERKTVGFRIEGDAAVPLATKGGSWDATGAPLVWRGDAEWLARDGITPPPGAVFAYLPDGRSTPFSVTFRGAGPATTCVTDGWSPVKCDAP